MQRARRGSDGYLPARRCRSRTLPGRWSPAIHARARWASARKPSATGPLVAESSAPGVPAEPSSERWYPQVDPIRRCVHRLSFPLRAAECYGDPHSAVAPGSVHVVCLRLGREIQGMPTARAAEQACASLLRRPERSALYCSESSCQAQRADVHRGAIFKPSVGSAGVSRLMTP